MSLVRKVTIDGKRKRLSSSSNKGTGKARRMVVSRPLGMKGVHTFNRYTTPTYLGFNNINGFVRGASVEGFSLGFYFNLIGGVNMAGAIGNVYALPDQTDFSNLFDRYRLKSIEMTIIHTTDSTAGVVSTGAPMLPTYYIYPDYNNSGTSTVNNALCREGLIIWKPSSDNAIFKKKFYPRILTSENSTTAPEMPRDTFVPVDSAARYHGIRIASDSMNQVTSTVVNPLTILFKFEMDFKTYQ